jgi:HK97 family phage prohead protease
MKQNREYRNCQTFRIELNEDAAEAIAVTGYATTFDQPYTLYSQDGVEVREVVDPKAFDKCDMTDVIMQYNHEGRVFARVKNGTLAIMPDEHGLRIQANLGGTEIGRQLYEEIRGGYTDKMSFGFTVSDEKRETAVEGGKTIITRRITGIGKLYDVSAVSIPANDSTSICARSFCEGVIAELEAERLSVLQLEKSKLKIKISMEG